jgi:hypothetical protein
VQLRGGNVVAAADASVVVPDAHLPPATGSLKTGVVLAHKDKGLIGGEPVRELPLNGRNFVQLALLMPGVSSADGVRGIVTDPSGAAIENASIRVSTAQGEVHVYSDERGHYSVHGLPHGPTTLTVDVPGFKTAVHRFDFRGGDVGLDVAVDVGAIQEQITIETRPVRLDREEIERRETAATSNVWKLQRRVAGVLPVTIEVPREGTSHRFVRPLVLDEETTIELRYKRR